MCETDCITGLNKSYQNRNNKSLLNIMKITDTYFSTIVDQLRNLRMMSPENQRRWIPKLITKRKKEVSENQRKFNPMKTKEVAILLKFFREWVNGIEYPLSGIKHIYY